MQESKIYFLVKIYQKLVKEQVQYIFFILII